MKIQFDPEDLEIIAEKLADRLKVLLANKSCNEKEDEILNIEQAAHFLKITKGTLYQFVHNSQHGLSDFPFLKAGRLLRFSKRSMIQWLQANSKRLENR